MRFRFVVFTRFVTNGRTDDGRTDGRRTDDGRTDGRTTDGRTDGRRTDGRRTDGRTDDGRPGRKHYDWWRHKNILIKVLITRPVLDM